MNWPKAYGLIDSYQEMLTRPLRFIQIGANDGVRHDPIHSRVIGQHWQGVLVEPEPEQFQALKKNYAGVDGLSFVNAAITEEDGLATLSRFKSDRGGESHSLDRDAAQKSAKLLGIKAHAGEIEEVTVSTMSLPTLIEQTGSEDVDLIAIDAEGYDGRIVRALLTSGVRPAFVLYENLMMTKPERLTIRQLLNQQGYRSLALGQDTLAYRSPSPGS